MEGLSVPVANSPVSIEDEARRAFYSALISDTTRRQYLRFVKNLKERAPDKDRLGRSAVLEFRRGQPATATRFEEPEDLQRYLDDLTQHRSCSGQGPCRRLWLLEDVSKSYIETL